MRWRYREILGKNALPGGEHVHPSSNRSRSHGQITGNQPEQNCGNGVDRQRPKQPLRLALLRLARLRCVVFFDPQILEFHHHRLAIVNLQANFVSGVVSPRIMPSVTDHSRGSLSEGRSVPPRRPAAGGMRSHFTIWSIRCKLVQADLRLRTHFLQRFECRYRCDFCWGQREAARPRSWCCAIGKCWLVPRLVRGCG